MPGYTMDEEGSDYGPAKFQHRDQVNLDNKTFRSLKKTFGIKSMIDVGCGFGQQVEYARGFKVDAHGVDGDPSLKIYGKDYFHQHDYTTGPYVPGKVFDLGWSMEFLEHVYPKYLNNIFSTFKKCKMVFCTHAIPHQMGTHHVNCQEDEYWIDQFNEQGFSFDLPRTLKIRSQCESVYTVRGGLLFINTKLFVSGE